MEEEALEQNSSKIQILKINGQEEKDNPEDGLVNDLEDPQKNIENGTPRIPTWLEILPQIVAACCALSITIQAGIGLSYSAILIPQLAEDENIKNFTKVEASWVASITAIASPVGSLFVGPIMDAVGRRTTCALSTVPIIASWIITYLTGEALWPIYVARFLVGFGSGMTTAGIVYTAEISHAEYRGVLLCLNSVTVALGILVTTVFGVYLHWRTAALCFGVIALASFVLCFLIPESPYWFANFRRSDKRLQLAKRDLRRLNRPLWLFEAEWERLEEGHTTKDESGAGDRSALRRLADRASVGPLSILAVLFLLQQLSGTYIIILYAVNIFQAVGGDFGGGVDKWSANMLLGMLRFIMSIVTALLSRRVGRRPLMMVSSLGMALSCLSVSLLQYGSGAVVTDLLGKGAPPPSGAAQWAVLVSLLLFVCTAALGVMALPWVLIGELLPTSVRAIGSGLCVSYAYVLMFVVVKTFPFLLEYISLASVFLVYSVISALSVVYVYFYLPETFGKSFAQIAKSFKTRDNSS